MTITELIKELERLRNEFGEKEVCIPISKEIRKPITTGGLITPNSGTPYIILYNDNK